MIAIKPESIFLLLDKKDIMKKIIFMLLLITATAAFTKAQDTTRVKRTPEEKAAQHLQMLQRKLNLTASQSKQIGTILQEGAEKMDGPKMKGIKGRSVMRMQAMKETDNKVEAVLTNEQKQTYDAMKVKMKEKRMNKQDAKATNQPVKP
jgi:protein CpxP